MSKKGFTNNSRIMLGGAWSIDRAAELHELLCRQLDGLLQKEPVPLQAELDLAELSELDVCGCQLLTLFMENLRRRDITPIPCGLTGQSREKVALLGFSEAFAVRDRPAGP